MPFEFEITRRVEFSETDMEGIMHYSNYFRFMETVEHGFFRSLGFSVVLSRHGLNLCLPRVHAECDYFEPLHFEDEVLIRLIVEKKGSRSLTYQIRFFVKSETAEREVARGKLVVVCAARQKDGKLKSVQLPPEISGQIQEAPRHLLVDGPRGSARNGAGSTEIKKRGRKALQVSEKRQN
jgi:acyl-CoA thioester hydrolase